jgi:hypothetical protein
MAQDTILGTDSVQAALKTKVNDDMTELFATKTEVENARDGAANLLAQIDSLQALIAALTPAGGVYTACTAATRPAFGAISNGHLIYETDTFNFYTADVTGSTWILKNGNRYASGSFPTAGATYTINTGTRAFDTTGKEWAIYDGSSWGDDSGGLVDALLFGGI